MTKFIICIDLLGAVQRLPQLFLRQIGVFPQIAYSTVHIDHLSLIIFTAFCSIDIYNKMQ